MSKRALRIPRLRVKNRQRVKPVVKNRRAAAAPRKGRGSATTTAPRANPVATTLFAVAIVTVFVAATLALPGRLAPVAAAGLQPEQPHESSDVALATQPLAPPSAPTAVRTAVAPTAASRLNSESSEKTGLSQAEKNQIAESATPAAAVTAISEALGKIDSTPAAVPASSESVSVEPALVSPDSAAHETVTITGCLEGSGNENQFRLTDTEGGDAP